MLSYEKQVQQEMGAEHICGCDEVGRGCLAGPVVAAAVFIPVHNYELLEGVTDSKQLSEKQRAAFFEQILEASFAGIGIIQAGEIDVINIYEASRKAMMIAVKNLAQLVPIDHILTDAMPLPASSIPYTSIIKGDQKSLTIAAASIIAKKVRDQIMVEYDHVYPQYHFAQHKGYGTKKHLAALAEFGIIENIHRVSYKPVKEILITQEALF